MKIIRNWIRKIDSAATVRQFIPDNFFGLPYEGGEKKYTYVVTAPDAFGNEWKGKKIKINL